MNTIPFFLSAGIAILVILLVVVTLWGDNRINDKKNRFRWVYLACFLLLAAISISTVKKYLYPKDDRVFQNTDYHVLEHKGFITDSVFYLVQAQYPENFFPEKSLWDGKSGIVKLTPDSIFVADYCEPFYVEKKDLSYHKKDSLTHHKGNSYVLVNKPVSIDVERDGLVVTRSERGRADTLYRLSIVQDGKKTLYLSSISSPRADTSQFKRAIKEGYPLSEILSQTPGLDFGEDLQELFEGTLLVREKIDISSDSGASSSRKNESRLLLFPGSNLYYSDGILINGNAIEPNASSTPYYGETLFYSGLRRSTTDVYKLSYHPEDGTLNIRYTLPKMQKLRADGGRLFIASSVETILEDAKEGGYYYNIFDSENNFNHISGEIRFTPGTPRENLLFEIQDIYAANTSDKNHVSADKGDGSQEFLLSVRAKSTDRTKWIFDVLDLRESNPLQWEDIVRFIFLFVFLVGLRIVIDSMVRPRTLSVIELAAYVVVFSLCVVRLILGWRASTFVPIEDISAAMFYKMRASVFSTTLPVCALPLIMIILSFYGPFSVWLESHKAIKALWEFPVKVFQRIKEAFAKILHGIGSAIKRFFRNRLPEKMQNWLKKVWKDTPNKDVVLLFLLSLGVCALICRGSLTRLMNIPAPLVLYILFDYWLVIRDERVGTARTARVTIALIAFAYLFVKDAGFTVIFFVFVGLYHAVIGTMVNGDLMHLLIGKNRWNKIVRKKAWPGLLIGCVFAILLFFFLRYEGNLMIWAFYHISFVLLGLGAFAAILFLISFMGKKSGGENALLRFLYASAAVILLGAGIYESIPSSSHFISELANSKAHMKYRAEIQKLDEGQKIDDLIEKSDFNSSDITYIMRSAHNQWFINQYLRAGERLKTEKKHFILQPHSNQGSTYTTQTTDLVITRYVLAEHGNLVVILFMAMFLLLILGYVFEVNLRENKKRAMLEPVLLMFVIGLMVFLSATNRIVFVGQDFPFISLQSRVAILFPTALLLLAILSITMKTTTGHKDKHKKIDSREWACVSVLTVFAICCVLFIPQQGKKQNETQFDVSRLIQSLSEKVDMLDRSLMKYQRAKDTNTLQKDSLWRAFSRDDDYSAPLQEILEDNSEENRFYRSLIDYFNSRQAVKNDPEELLHMRKRSGYWHLAVNKKHFFIQSMLEESLPWRGDLLAAKTEQFFLFKDTKGKNVKKIVAKGSFDRNILPSSIQGKVMNVHISRFDPSWTDDGEPLLLINANQSKGSPQFFHIETAGETIQGSSSEHQVATRIMDGDLVLVNKMENGEEKEVLGWRYGMESDNYLAKNIWMNGRQKLFYPLGKESMWSYQFANAVSTSFGGSEEYRDSTLRISIDYDLHEKFYEILNGKNKTRAGLSMSTVEQLQRFQELSLPDMQNIHNASNFYYDTASKTVKYKKRANREITSVVKRINDLIVKADVDKDKDTQITDAIDRVIERNYDFSAVAIDGNGRIRLLFDHTRTRNIDPNNIRYLNKFMSDMYKNGDNQSERDVFGNKALQILPSGPGSSFKPIAYTAVTSRQKLAWEQLDLKTDYMGGARSEADPRATSTMYDYYGGVDCAKQGTPLSIDGGNALLHNNYLIYSDNLYHSAIILLGMQQQGELERIFKSAGSDKYAFPVISYRGNRYSFDPARWFANNDMHPENGVLNDGLHTNFNLQGDLVGLDDRYTNYYGDSPMFSQIFENSAGYKAWTYPETGSLNVYDRRLQPQLRNAFNQMFLGAHPLEVTPLQMAIMGMRLATLNRTPSLATLDDSQKDMPAYEAFNVPTWSDSTEYFQFYQRQVLSQLRQVPKSGTARALNGLSTNLERKGYYIYAKTGTLNDERSRSRKDDRLKHLLVIISDRPLEKATSMNELKKAKYYVLYLSYIGISSKNFSTGYFADMISAVTNSELFKEYMDE